MRNKTFADNTFATAANRRKNIVQTTQKMNTKHGTAAENTCKYITIVKTIKID